MAKDSSECYLPELQQHDVSIKMEPYKLGILARGAILLLFLLWFVNNIPKPG